jgi:hypothetical protein
MSGILIVCQLFIEKFWEDLSNSAWDFQEFFTADVGFSDLSAAF